MDEKMMQEKMKQKMQHLKHAKHILPHIKFLHDRAEKMANNSLREKDLTLAQAHVLGYLRAKPDFQAPSKELEKSMNVAQSTSAGLIARLEKKSFIETFTDPNDKRVKLVQLTNVGLTAMQEIKGKFDAVEDKLLENLTEEEKETFFALIRKINTPNNK